MYNELSHSTQTIYNERVPAAHLVAESVWRVVHQHHLCKVTAKHIEVLQVVSVHVEAVFAVQTISETMLCSSAARANSFTK